MTKNETSELTQCRLCPRLVAHREQVGREKRRSYQDWEYWSRPVPRFGDPEATIIIVGLAPAAHGANRTGRMFTGDRSGDFLFAALHRLGFANQARSVSRDDGLRLVGVAITATVRCAPPKNRPLLVEIQQCAPFLDADLQDLPRRRVFLCLGKIGHDGLLRHYRRHYPDLTLARFPFSHGATHPLPDGRILLDSFHVSQQNTFTGRLTQAMFDDVLARARILADSRTPP